MRIDNVSFTIDLYWDDLIPKTRETILDILGDNGNFDVLPIAQIPFGESDNGEG